MRFSMIDSCLEQQDEAIKPCLSEFWVGLNGLGLGFHRRRREFTGGEEERAERRKIKNGKK